MGALGVLAPGSAGGAGLFPQHCGEPTLVLGTRGGGVAPARAATSPAALTASS